jgi:Family of unknown function (DUF6171)
VNWQEDMELVIAHTRVEAYRERCQESHPQHLAWRARMAEKAKAYRGKPVPEWPPLQRMAASLLEAAGQVVSAVVHAEPVLADDETKAARLATCKACEQYDQDSGRCRACGCNCNAKASIAPVACPLKKWEK